MLTAYDCPFARIINEAGIDAILVNDGVVGVIALGREDIYSTTIEEMAYHTRAVKAGAGDCAVITSMTFGSYNSRRQAVENAQKLVELGGAEAVHMEGDKSIADSVKAVTAAGIPVVAHIGLTKQIIASTGQTRLQAKDSEGMLNVFDDAQALVDAGACALVLECVPEGIAKIITNTFDIITIGIGAGIHCHGQFLVTQDILGLFPGFDARFLKRYADLSQNGRQAITAFRHDVETGAFPESRHSYRMRPEQLSKAVAQMKRGF